MSNLGGYQTLTTIAKRLGGPGRLIIATMVSGYVVIRVAEVAGKTVYEKINEFKKENLTKVKEFIVNLDATDEQGLVFKKGDHFKVLESDGDAVLIELIGDEHNPYFVSGDFLKKISDYLESEFS